MEISMPGLEASLPVLLYVFNVLSVHDRDLRRYFQNILPLWNATDPRTVFISLFLQPLSGLEFLSHYRQYYPEIKEALNPHFQIYGADKITSILNKITTSMAAWKLLLFQSRILKEHGTALLGDPKNRTLDIDWTTLVSFSSKREGAEVGMNKKYKGKPCFQLSASFIGRVFVDGHLFPGDSNPKVFFQKAVKRVIVLGIAFQIVRADSAYLSHENLRLLQKLSLGYAIGAPANFKAVKEGIARFKELARKKHHSIVQLSKGVSALDLGQVGLSHDVSTRMVIVRRISRRKNRRTNKWRVRTYFYAIATNLTLSVPKLYAFYHKRQCIESGFRELKRHYHLERLPVQSLKGNEFWIICKMVSMTLLRLFQLEMLPRAYRSLSRATLLRSVLINGISMVDGKVQIRPKARHKWVLQRLMGKLQRMETAVNL
jgi:hypothetical protein